MKKVVNFRNPGLPYRLPEAVGVLGVQLNVLAGWGRAHGGHDGAQLVWPDKLCRFHILKQLGCFYNSLCPCLIFSMVFPTSYLQLKAKVGAQLVVPDKLCK